MGCKLVRFSMGTRPEPSFMVLIIPGPKDILSIMRGYHANSDVLAVNMNGVLHN